MGTVRTYAVTAATGHVGGHAARALLRAGHKVRVMGREAERLKQLEAVGAEIVVGDLADRVHLEEAFTGVDGALLIVPPFPAASDFVQYQIDIAAGYAAATTASGLRHAVSVSVLGANDSRAGALIEGHANIEAELNKAPGLNLVHLQPTSFFEILYYYLQPLRDERVLRTPLGTDARLQLVAARDVGEVGANLLGELQFRGISTFPLHPLRTISLREIAGLLTEYHGQEFTVEQISAQADIEDLTAAGTGLSFATLLNETWALATAMGEMPQTDPLPQTAAQYRIEDFVRDELVPAIDADRPIADYSTATRPRRSA
ncbi:SDR family oxidoreductase [Actinomadura nitritigenes]|uniref:SDR family oxidoreductase n=1 Tax=Actinomadura nitritigenes TaxID=134602 RepID=UPI003D913391